MPVFPIGSGCSDALGKMRCSLLNCQTASDAPDCRKHGRGAQPEPDWRHIRLYTYTRIAARFPAAFLGHGRRPKSGRNQALLTVDGLTPKMGLAADSSLPGRSAARKRDVSRTFGAHRWSHPETTERWSSTRTNPIQTTITSIVSPEYRNISGIFGDGLGLSWPSSGVVESLMVPCAFHRLDRRASRFRRASTKSGLICSAF